MVTYEVGDLTVTAPRDWSALARANAACELRHGFELSALAALALHAAMHAAIPSASTREVVQGAADLLEAGWCPGDEVQAFRVGGIQIAGDPPNRPEGYAL